MGLWHLGVVNAAGFAEKGYRVIGIEDTLPNLRRLQGGKPPLFEPGLAKLMKKHLRAGRLHFTSKTQAMRQADYAVIAYDSPVNERDEVDVTPILKAANVMAPYLQVRTPVIITSQVPLGTTQRAEELIKKAHPQWQSGAVYIPENLKLGEAIRRFVQPDMLVLGVNNTSARHAAVALYKPFRTKKVIMDTRSAEMFKHALNTWLATSITFINEIANLSDFLGVNAVAVGQALKLDKRIGPQALLRPGLGFAGGTLARDVKQLQKYARQAHCKATLLQSIMAVNEGTFVRVIEKLKDKLGSLRHKKVGVLGLTYKPGTSTMRRSPALSLIERMRAHDAQCVAFDPRASQQESTSYRHLFRRVGTVTQLARNADALVLVTEWPEFSRLKYATLARIMRQPLIVDTKNFLNPEKLRAAGFEYIGFGQPAPPVVEERNTL